MKAGPRMRAARHGGLALIAVLWIVAALSLLVGGLVRAQLDPIGAELFLAHGFVPGPHTLFDGVRKLPPACTLIFVRGRRRVLAEGGRLGFHAPYEVGARGRMRPVDSKPERAAYRAAGLPSAFVTRALAVSPAAIWIPDAAQLCAAGIVTGLVGPDSGAGEHEPRPCGGRQP